MVMVFRKIYWVKIFPAVFYHQAKPDRDRDGTLVSYDIVKAHGGEVKMERKVKVSEFTIKLPIA
jgi:hypothetical protein